MVHAGLDLLVAEIKNADPIGGTVLIERRTADFVIQMFSASESAINILNDLLQYEHIEAGAHIEQAGRGRGGISIEHTVLEKHNYFYDRNVLCGNGVDSLGQRV